MIGRLRLAVGVGFVLMIGASAIGEGPGDGPIRLAQKTAARKKARARKEPAEARANAKGAPAAKADDGAPKFSRDIAPILVGNCTGCHNPEQKRGQFDLTTFQRLRAGGKDGEVIVAGKPEESRLVLHVKGEEGYRKMPPNNRDLSAEAIGKIEGWVKAGALLDAGIDPKAPLASYAASPEDLRRMALERLPAAERDKKTTDVGLGRWKKASPKTTPEVTPSAHFLLFGTLPKDRAAHTLKALESQYAFLRRLLSRPGLPALGGPEKISVYVFNDANGFAEFARGVENREVDPQAPTAHGNLATEAPYLVAADPLAGGEDEAIRKKGGRPRRGEPTGPERGLAGLLAEQLGVAAAAARGKAPRYLCLGLGAFVASRVEPRSPYIRRLHAEVVDQYQLGWVSKSQDALADGADEAKLRAVGLSLIEWLAATDAQAMVLFVHTLLEGQNQLDVAIRELGGADRGAFLAQWGSWIASHYGRG